MGTNAEYVDSLYELHKDHKSRRALSKEHDTVGVAGEAAFAERYGLKMDRSLRPSGDQGHDFVTKFGTIDIKTFRKPYNLLVEKGKVRAHVYVLAKYFDEDGHVEFLGWELGIVIRECPCKDFGYGVINHFRHSSSLRPMHELDAIIELCKREE